MGKMGKIKPATTAVWDQFSSFMLEAYESTTMGDRTILLREMIRMAYGDAWTNEYISEVSDTAPDPDPRDAWDDFLEGCEDWLPTQGWDTLLRDIMRAWDYSLGTCSVRNGRYRFFTAQHPGNESIIASLRRNRDFCEQCWESSTPRGRYVFVVRQDATPPTPTEPKH